MNLFDFTHIILEKLNIFMNQIWSSIIRKIFQQYYFGNIIDIMFPRINQQQKHLTIQLHFGC